MLTYLLRRLLLIVPTLLGMTLVIFLVMALSPGGIGASIVNSEGAMMRPAEKAALEKYLNARYGLDKPLPVQYLRWLNKVSPVGFPVYQEADAAVAAGEARAGDMRMTFPRPKWPDLGDSIKRGRPVGDLIREAAPVTLLLNLLIFPTVYVIAVATGVLAARKRGGAFDVASGTTLLGLWSLPNILVCTMAIGFLANEQYVHWFPTNDLHDLLAGDMRFLPGRGPDGAFQRGFLLDFAWHLVLPLICLGYGQLAFLTKLSRSATLENLSADYARTARAKGLAERDVLFRHVFRNSLIPLITVAAGILPAMLSGAIVVETVFGINGMGRLAVSAVFEKDPELVLSTALVSGLLGLLGYLLADVGYAIADPRVSYDG